METMLLAAGVVTILVIALVVRQVVRGCARTVFATPPEPSPEEIQASRTPKPLPPAADPAQIEGLDSKAITEQASASLIAWMQAVNDRDAARLEGAACALRAQLADDIQKQTAKGWRERFERPAVHGAVVTAYDTDTQMLTVALNAQAVHYIACGGQLIRGREDLPEQMLWELRGPCTPGEGWTPSSVQMQG